MSGLLPPDLALAEALLLIVTAGFTSMLTAAMGIGGGLLLLAVMGQIVPLNALIPVHGLVQLGSNANRALMMRKHIDWRMAGLFAAGAIPGAILASMVVIQLPLVTIQLCIGLFILWLVWGPKLSKHELSRASFMLMGALTTVLTVFVGATGPMVGAFIHRNSFDRFRTVGTFATCLSVQHMLKAAVFSFIGFSFIDWLGLSLLMVASGALGTWIGLNLLKKIPPERFSLIFKTLVTLLALRLIWLAVSELI
ncbi:sulfite exporter TauE/SafE family protein [Marinobacterium mangrovicola]|uniref:Probable membrane transporter protein n=1 Tax=Marinobacterium mangrovicola TaxID=1476959 RepID=A0A4V2PGD7_9GAMM|nr:sulfite exporter TauE/SafE family protein [Marinobacterium mangrovicola]TCK16466.1 sulfite exporter TauE/SafE [Marinobacterium mangrovicola]